jgi:hypothetical protein
MKKMLEKQIEERVGTYAKEQGFLVYKFTSPQRAAVPDRLYINPRGKVFFVEFKREGVKPTPAQQREHERLRDQGVMVFVIDDVDKGRAMVNQMRLKC